MKFDEFLSRCIPHGGNWTSMFLSGIKAVSPDLYDRLPDRKFEFDEVAFIVNHLCEDRPHFRYNISTNGQIIEFTPKGVFNFRAATSQEMAMSVSEFYEKYNGYVEPSSSVTSDDSTMNSERDTETKSSSNIGKLLRLFPLHDSK